MAPFHDNAEALAWLRGPSAVRDRCAAFLDLAERGRLANFALDEARLGDCVSYVADTIRQNYPDLVIPFHARWRHFSVGGLDRWGQMAAACRGLDRDEVARIRFDLVVTSVLLDAGAGAPWRYREAETGGNFARSEGLAVASFRFFEQGGFSAREESPWRADAEALQRLDEAALAVAFQVSADNPLVGLAGRGDLLRRLGRAVSAAPEVFGAREPRVGRLYDYLKDRAVKDRAGGRLPAPEILAAVQRGLGAIWPGRITLAGVNLGDVWRHPAIRSDDGTDGLVPFHKLSQWLVYSLIEPLEEAGVEVVELDALTGLAEYRNGGLFLDCGVLVPKHAAVLDRPHGAGSSVIVEWRALTVALLDRLADPVRRNLGLDRASLPLAKLLEGGTWAAGRRIAAEKRAGGPPPIALESDGTVF